MEGWSAVRRNPGRTSTHSGRRARVKCSLVATTARTHEAVVRPPALADRFVVQEHRSGLERLHLHEPERLLMLQFLEEPASLA